MSAVDDWKAQRGTGHNYATPALADAAIAELEAGNQSLMEMCNNCERLEKAEAEVERLTEWAERNEALAVKAGSELAEMKAGSVSHETLIATECERDAALAELAEMTEDARLYNVARKEALAERDTARTELAEMKARRCGTCLFSEICLAHVDSTEGLFPVESCSRWTPQP